jgi:hypothetical protein
MIFNGDGNTYLGFGPVNFTTSTNFSVLTPPWTIGGVTLPYGPTEISDDVECETDSLQLDADEAVVFATAPGLRVVIWSGSVCDVNYPTKRDLDGMYGAALRSMQGLEVAVSNPSGAYTGNWYIKKVSLNEQAEGSLAKVGYSIVMWQGSGVELL